MSEELYSGKGDSFLDFSDSAVDFGSEAAFDKIFRIRILNASAADQLVILNPSYSPSNKLRVVKDGNINYNGAGALDLSSTGSPNTIEELHSFVKANPTSVVKMMLKTNNVSQLSHAILLNTKSPFSTPQSSRINLESYTSEFQNNDKQVSIKREFQLDDQTEVSIIIPGAIGGVATDTTVTFYCGVTLNPALCLKGKKSLALMNPMVTQTKAAFK